MGEGFVVAHLRTTSVNRVHQWRKSGFTEKNIYVTNDDSSGRQLLFHFLGGKTDLCRFGARTL